ncbi:MAG: hypothetical protein ACRDLB_10615 [Actinomycetota bacterium]
MRTRKRIRIHRFVTSFATVLIVGAMAAPALAAPVLDPGPDTGTRCSQVPGQVARLESEACNGSSYVGAQEAPRVTSDRPSSSWFADWSEITGVVAALAALGFGTLLVHRYGYSPGRGTRG